MYRASQPARGLTSSLHCPDTCASQHVNDKLLASSGAASGAGGAGAGAGDSGGAARDHELDFREVLNTQLQVYMIRAHEDAESSVVEELQLRCDHAPFSRGWRWQ